MLGTGKGLVSIESSSDAMMLNFVARSDLDDLKVRSIRELLGLMVVVFAMQ